MENHLQLQNFREALQKFIVFENDEWDIFKEYLRFSTLNKKEHFIVEGKVCREMAFITTGAVRYYHLKDGNEITGYFSFEYELISSYKSFLRQQPAPNYIQALEKTELINISKENWDLLLQHPKLAFKMERFGRLVAEYYICCYEDRITSFITQSPEERYLLLQKEEKHIFQRVPQHFIANFLGITAVSLSRIRKRTLAL